MDLHLETEAEAEALAKPKVSPRVSIVTPSYNQGRFIEKTILSVLGQDYPNLEYIVVDAVSTDKTQTILEKYRSDLDCLIIEPDRGQTDALNKGFQRCTGDIIAYLNSDDCYASETVISTVVAYFQEHPAIDAIYGQRNCINAKGFFTYCSPYRPFCKDGIYLSDYIPQECTFWQRSIFEKSGFYADESFHFAMDYELWLRFLKHDANFLAVEEVFGLFRSYQQQKSIDLWETVGLPEIARLHQIYLGRAVPEREMVDCYEAHFFGAHPITELNAFKFAQRAWGAFMQYKREVLKDIALDEWGIRAYKQRRLKQQSLDVQ